MSTGAAERALFGAVERVMAAELKLASARAEYETVYAEIFGTRDTPHCGGTLSGSEGGLPLVAPHGGNLASDTASRLRELDQDGRPATIRAQVEQYCRANSGRSLRAETIANAVGAKLTTTRYELYQLKGQKILRKVGIDQWQYAKPRGRR